MPSRSPTPSPLMRVARYVLYLLCLCSAYARAANIPDTNICFDNPNNFNNPYIYYWNGNPAVDAVGWPGQQMTTVENYRCYDFGTTLNSLNVIFSNNGSQQTANLNYTNGNNCYSGGQWTTLDACGLKETVGVAANFTLYFRNDVNYTEPHVHYFNMVPAQPESNWPGPAMTSLGNNWYSYDFGAATSGDAVFNDNGAPQTGNLAINANTPCYQNNQFVSMAQCDYNPAPTPTPTPPPLTLPVGNAVYFVNTNNFQTPTAYLWNPTPAGSITEAGWPGAAMTEVGTQNLWFIDVAENNSAAQIIFNDNGANQTPDLDYSNGLTCYNNGTWMTPVQCGVPANQAAEAGPDRQANQDAQIALSAMASDGDPTNAVWTSPAWSGDLTGAHVVTPQLSSTGTFTVTLTLTNGETDTFQLSVVSATQGLPERPLLAAPLGFPTTGSVSSGNYEFESAFPNLDGLFVSPVMVLNDGVNDLIYVVDKPGTITVFANDPQVTQAEATQLLDIRNEVRDYHEQGLISMAFHPNFAQNGFAYIYYIEGENDEESSGGRFDDGVLQRITLNDTTNPTGIVGNSRIDVLRVPQVGPDHKGGKMQFHPSEGYFYMSFGDGAYGATAIEPNPTGDQRTNNSSQENDNLRGTFIRIEMLDNPIDGKYYRVPSDNPFVNDPNALDEIWSYGHRNPWRWAFDTEAPYTLWETEIGQSGFEEVNIIQKGGNYGWPICEGLTHRGNDGGDPTNQYTCDGNLIPPVEGYDHSTSSVSIIGGFVYRGTTLANLRGRFIFGDYVSKRIWTMVEGEAKVELSNGFPGSISSFGTDLSGDQILVSTHGLEYDGGVSGIYRIVDRDAQAAVIPANLSETGLFADLPSLFPASGVIEYDVQSDAWLDGATTRHFVSVPNDATINFDATNVWDLPTGSVLIKHVDLATSASQSEKFETSVLFKQETGWEAANYRWNAGGTDASLVETTAAETVQQFIDGNTISVTRSVRAGSDCGSCHNGNASKDPRGFSTRQLNSAFSYQGVSDNQIDVFNAINMFTGPVSVASSYDTFVDPENTSADINERAKVYLDTNCSSCHSGTLMDLRYDTALADMDIMNTIVGGGQYRMLPFDHTRSVLYAFQTTDSNRMPKGTTVTNSLAESLFRTWIDGAGATQTGMSVRTETSADDIRVGGNVTLDAFALYNNGFEAMPSGGVSWSSTNSARLDVSAASGSQITVSPGAEGAVTVSAQSGGFTGNLALTVLGGPDAPTDLSATALSSTAISLNWVDVSTEETSYTIARSNSSAGPFSTIETAAANTTSYVDTGLNPSTRYYYEVRAVSADGPSIAASAFADTLEPGGVDSISIETANITGIVSGEARQLVAVANSAGDLSSATLSAAWSTSNASVVNVSPSGVITGGNTTGTATITASFEGVSATAQITNLGGAIYVYFNNDSTNWETPRIHVFSTSGGQETSHTAWPGDAMTPSTEYGGKWLRYTITEAMQGSDMTEVIFNCGSGDCQTADLVLNAATPWFEDVTAINWLANEPNGGGAVNEGTQIVVGRGEVSWANNGQNLSGTLITPGALVDIVADNPGTGQTFVRWEGTAAPYMLDPSSPTTIMLVPDALSLTLNAVFETVTDQYATGRNYYRSTEAGCTSCHGLDGNGSTSLANVPSTYTLSQLTTYIENNMPQGNGAACTGECASSIAEMIMAEAYATPDGVCDINSLEDMVPQDRGYRLLTVYEYNNSVRDLLGLSTDVDVTTGNLPADIPVNGFKTSANTVFTDDYAQGYVNAASQVADLAGSSIAGLVPGCSNASCFIPEFGKKVFRRPLTSAEVTSLQAVHTAEGDRGLLITMFSAPAMLYRSEVGELISTGDNIGYFQLTDHEIAAMLSYSYWGTTPSDAMIALADAGQLSTPQQIRNQAADMLSDPRAEVAFDRFVSGWLNLDKEIGTNALSDSLKADMKEETVRFVKNIVFNGGSYEELITANYSMMTQQLANHYGLTWPGGSGWQQVNYTGERRGVMGHASILAIQSAQEKTHPVKRGLFVRRNLMCQDFPPPPLGAALDPVSDPAQGVRHRFEVSHAQPGCESCHQFIDGIGFGFESYNAIGQFVTTETTDNGSVLPINANGYIGSLNSAETFLSESEPVEQYVGLDQLSSLIAGSTNGKACYARQWFRYARGRHEAPEDSCTLQDFGSTFKESTNANLLDLMIEYTQTINYTLRK